MNAEDIVILQKVAERNDKTHRMHFLAEQEASIRASMDALDEEEMRNEDYILEELVALNR